MFILHVIGWILFGLIVGFIARLLMPGNQPMGYLMTIGLGILGSFLGGTLSSLMFGDEQGFPAAGWIGSVLGALLLLFLYGMFASRAGKRRIGP